MHVYHHCPLPPARNGIADYAARVNDALLPHVNLSCVWSNPFAQVPDGVEVLDPRQAWRFREPGALPIYQIGNNGDHLDIYRQALEVPGLVILHDLRLFYLHELMDLPRAKFGALMAASNPIMARTRLEDIMVHWRKLGTDYFCFDMIWDLLRRSRMIMVHSHYARNILVRTYGALAERRVAVIPHFALEPQVDDVAAFRQGIGVPESTMLFVTSGFATQAKRFDWVAESLAALAADGHDIQWVHAGAERSYEYDLSGLIAQHPELDGRATVTGFLSESELDGYLAAADVVLNLRFPSVGESSGTLARAFAAGSCCVVTRTAAYDEIPDDVVVKVPPFDTVRHLTRALTALVQLPEARAAFGRNARTHATTTLSPASYASALVDLVHHAATMQPEADTALLDRPEDADRLSLGPFKAEELSPSDLHAMIPSTFLAQSMKIRRDDKGQMMLDVTGLNASRTAGGHGA